MAEVTEKTAQKILAAKVAAKLGDHSTAEVERMLKATTETIGEEIQKGERVFLTHFGTFVTKVRKGGVKQVPRPDGTTVTVSIPDRKYVKFSEARDLKNLVNAV